MKKIINVAILGLGTVGGGVELILRENKDLIQSRLKGITDIDVEIKLKWILDKYPPKDERLVPFFTNNYDDILNDSDVDIVIETIGGIEPATSFMKKAMVAKKHVITANKAAIANAFGELERVAHENNVMFMYEASVGGTIPVLIGLRQGLIANEILKIRGIVNGTTNFILTKMNDSGASFDDVLKEAQAKGFAEADPSSDVDGYDAMYKLAILCYLAYGEYPKFEDIERVSLRTVTLSDVESAKANDKVIKYVASADATSGKLVLKVKPEVLDMTDPLAHVNGVLNTVSFTCDRAGVVTFTGAGAGSQPTASAVISDIISIVLQSKNL